MENKEKTWLLKAIPTLTRLVTISQENECLDIFLCLTVDLLADAWNANL